MKRLKHTLTKVGVFTIDTVFCFDGGGRVKGLGDKWPRADFIVTERDQLIFERFDEVESFWGDIRKFLVRNGLVGGNFVVSIKTDDFFDKIFLKSDIFAD